MIIEALVKTFSLYFCTELLKILEDYVVRKRLTIRDYCTGSWRHFKLAKQKKNVTS